MSDYKRNIYRGLEAMIRASDQDFPDLARSLIATDSIWDIAHPVEKCTGRDAVVETFLTPLRRALTHIRRRDILFIGGDNTRDAGGKWCAAVTHYVGNFDQSLFGLRPSGKLALLRSGEFYRIENDQIVEAKIIFDLPDLAHQSGRNPFPPELGTEICFPAPATQDGLLPTVGNGAASLAVVEAMLGDLHAYDPKTGASPGQTGTDGYWHEDMMWYGPTGVGSNYRWDGFVRDHRASFLKAFPDRKGGNHYCRIGDGNYAAVSGWPSMTMTHKGDYLGVEATNKALTLRVMDFYRCQSGQIIENWVCLDYVDLFHQMGVDLIDIANSKL